MTQAIYYRCDNCGHRIRGKISFQGQILGSDCFEKLATEFIEKRDAILNANMDYETEKAKLNKLSKEYAVS